MPNHCRSNRKRTSKNCQQRTFDFRRLEPRYLLTAGNGLLAQYFNSEALTGVELSRVDSTVNFDWGSGSPDATIGSDNFSAHWSGQVEAAFTETYDFIVNANDGARLWVNGQQLVSGFDASGVSDATGSIDLIAGRRYDIQLEYREATGNASVQLEWRSFSQTREIIPQDRLYSAELGSLTQEVWTGINGDSVSDLTSDPDFPLSPDSIASVASFEVSSDQGDDFGQRVRGYLTAPQTGPYQFFIAGDESAELWLSTSRDASQSQLIATVDSSTAPRGWTESASQQSAIIYLAAGQTYYVEALHKEAAGEDHLAVGWLKPDQLDIEVIPGEHLSPVQPEVRIFSSRPKFSESSPTPGRFTIVRSGTPLNNPLTVNYALLGDAVNGVDYQSLPGNITIPAGQEYVDLVVNPIIDGLAEGDEAFTVELVHGDGYKVGFKGERTAFGTLQDDSPLPAGGTSLWAGTDLSNFSRFGGTFTTENDPVYGDVIQAVIDDSQSNPWNAQLRQGINGPVTSGDILFVEFRVKSVGGEGTIAAIFEKSGSPFTKSLTQGIPVTPTWEKIQIPFFAAESYSAGQATFGFHLAYGAQTVQFADFQVLNYGPPKLLAPETSFNLNNISGTWGVSQSVSVEGQPFSIAYEVETQTLPDQSWHLQAVERNEGVVANADVMRFEFYVRATTGANPRTGFVVQETTNYSTLFRQDIDLTSDWQFFSIDVPANADYGLNGLQAVFNLGHELQTVQIGGFFWTNESNHVDLDELPAQFPGATYEGRLGTDAWRATAEQDIDNVRKSEVTVNVTDSNGNPLEGAVVSLRQARHEFLFGSAINAYNGKLDPNGTDEALKYQSEIKRLFNSVVFENSLKWPGFLQDRQRGLDGVEFATDNDMYIRGHNVIWPSRTFMPDSIWAEYDTRTTNDGKPSADAWLKATIEDRFDDVLNTFHGVIPEWDVVNEPWSNHDVMDIFGDSIVIEWFQRMRDFDPDIKLALNDYGIFARNGGDTNHRANFEYWLGLLNDAGLLDVIGEQSHYQDASLTDIEVLGQLINTYHTQFDKPIAITEFDVDSVDEQLQADYLRDYMMMSFSQSAVTEFLHWGFWADSHWLPDAALYRKDFSIKPNGQAYEDLVFGRWWTDVQGTTRGGAFSTKSFLGEYNVVVEYQGQAHSGVVTVDDSGNSRVTVNVPSDPTNYDPILSVDQASTSGGVALELTNSGQWREPDGESVELTASMGEVVRNADGTWEWSFTPGEVYIDQAVTIVGTDTRGAVGEVSFTFSALTNIFRRGVTYGNASGFGETDLATSIVALMPGETASEANYTNFVFGLNRVVVEIAGLASNSLTTDDFEFRVGNTDDPSNWLLLTTSSSIPLPSVSVTNTSTDGVDQVLLSWPDNRIENQWLQVVVKANENTGLDTPDVFYFGNQIGDVNGDVNAQNRVRVNAFDTLQVRASHSTGTVDIDNRFDVDKSGRVNAFDTLRVRANHTTGGLLMFAAPSGAPAFSQPWGLPGSGPGSEIPGGDHGSNSLIGNSVVSSPTFSVFGSIGRTTSPIDRLVTFGQDEVDESTLEIRENRRDSVHNGDEPRAWLVGPNTDSVVRLEQDFKPRPPASQSRLTTDQLDVFFASDLLEKSHFETGNRDS